LQGPISTSFIQSGIIILLSEGINSVLKQKPCSRLVNRDLSAKKG
jgi:hypothetical protein